MFELFSTIPFIGPFLFYCIAFVFVLSIVIFVHEMGHYLVGRWCGIHAVKFSIGMGPVLASTYDKRGTKWQVAAIPIGGMVQFLGDADGASRADTEELADMDEETLKKSFHGSAIWKRMATVAAGPVANFILSAVVFAVLAMSIGLRSEKPLIGEVLELPGVENPLEPGDIIQSVNGKEVATMQAVFEAASEMEVPAPMQMRILRDGAELNLTVPYVMPALVGRAEIFTAARKAGIQGGDLITAIDGEEVVAFRQLLAAVEASEGKELKLTIQRDGEELIIPVAPKATEYETEDGTFATNYRIGVSLSSIYSTVMERLAPVDAIKFGVWRVYDVARSSLNAVWHIITGGLSAKNLQGPLGIAQLSGEQAKLGFAELIFLVGVISTAVGLVNLFPVPILDGGHLCFFTWEAITGKPPTEKAMQMIMPVGLAMVVLLMLFATYNDLLRLVEQFSS
ncbi:RIP metalloprotease RseP [Halovulum sp. GXIMD14793]